MSTSQIDPSARIASDVSIGAFCVVGPNADIGPGCRIGHHVVIHEGTVVGSGVRIDDHAVLGKQPMRARNSAITDARSRPPAHIGDGALVGTGAVLYAGCDVGPGVLVADYATVREDVQIGEGTIVGRGVAIENRCTVGRFCKLETNAYLCAYTTVEDRVFIAPGVVTSNDNYLGRTEERFAHFGGPHIRRGGRLGAGAVILPGKEIGSEAVVAAGAVLTHDAEPGTIFVGVPARPHRPVPPEQRLDAEPPDAAS